MATWEDSRGALGTSDAAGIGDGEEGHGDDEPSDRDILETTLEHGDFHWRGSSQASQASEGDQSEDAD